MKTFFTIALATFVTFTTTQQSLALISVGTLSPKEAKELGITMKSRKNGNAGVKVWLEFKKEGFLEKFTYAKLQMKDAQGNHLVSATLHPRPVVHGQPEELTSVSFSVEPAQLERCEFMIVAYNGLRGGVGYVLSVKDFLDLKKARE